MSRIAVFAALFLILSLPSSSTPTIRDLDVQVSSGSPLDWLIDLPQPIPTVSRTRLDAEPERKTVVQEAPHVQAADIFSFARITTVDLIGEIPWTVVKKSDKEEKAYPPRVNDDVLWLAIATFLRTLLHPAQVNDTEAFEYLTYLGEPALRASKMASNEKDLAGMIRKLRLYVSAMPEEPPEYVEGKDANETMMLRLTWDDLSRAHPFSFDKKFAARLSLLGNEAVPWVIRASRSDHSFLHRNAVVMLGRYDHPDALGRLREIVEKDLDPVSRIRAVEGLVRKRDPKAAGLFIRRVDRVHEKSFKLALIRGLGVLGDKKAIPTVTQTARRGTDDFDTLCTCLTALARLAPEPRKYPDVEKLLTKVSGLSFKDPRARYGAVIPDKPGTRNEILRTLVTMIRAARRSRPATKQIVAKVKISLAKRNNPGNRRDLAGTFPAPVVYALLQVLGKSREGHKLLLHIARNRSEELGVRCHALIELARSNPPDLVEWLTPFVDLTQDQPVAETAFRIIALLSPNDADPLARELVDLFGPKRTDPERSVILLGIRHLAERKKISAERLIAIAEADIIARDADPEPEEKKKDQTRYGVRKLDFISPVPFFEHLCVEIGRTGGELTLPFLADIVDVPDLPGRAEAAVGLGASRSPRALRTLTRALKDPDPWLRLMAYRALQYSTGKSVSCDWVYGSEQVRSKAARTFSIPSDDPKPPTEAFPTEPAEIIAVMRTGIEARRRGAAVLAELACKDANVARSLWRILDKEKDPRILLRLRDIAGRHLFSKRWQVTLKRIPLAAAAGKSHSWVQLSDNSVLAIRYRDGTFAWRSDPIDAWAKPPVVVGPYLYCVGKKQGHGIVAEDGKVVRQFRLGTPAIRADGDRVFHLNETGMKLVCTDNKTGETLWKCPARERSFAVGGGKIFLRKTDTSVQAVDAKTGKEVWEKLSDGKLNLLAAHEGLLITRSRTGRMRAYDPENGKGVWRRELEQMDGVAPILFLDGAFLTLGPRMVCRNLKTGDPLWDARPDGYGPNSRMLVPLGRFLVLRAGTELVLLSRKTGKEFGRFDTEVDGIRAMVPTENGVLVTTLDRRVILFDVLPRTAP